MWFLEHVSFMVVDLSSILLKFLFFLYPFVVLVTKLRNASLSDKFVLFYPIFIHFQVQGIFVWMNSPEVVA